MKYIISLLAVLLAAPLAAAPDWEAALGGAHRSDANKARDAFRHPQQTLEFFGLKQGMTVVEVSPGGGWYTEVLAPLVAGKGTLYAAHYSLNPSHEYYRKSLGKYLMKLAEAQDVYGSVVITQYQPPQSGQMAPEGSADLVVAFRNVHGWLDAGTADQTMADIFKTLKPGGVFGLVQHRAKPGTSLETMKESGYVTEELVLEMAAKAGFELAGRSEINANPKDTTDHAKGVWTLPPVLRLGDTDRAKYQAVGESDRMTFKFTKPK